MSAQVYRQAIVEGPLYQTRIVRVSREPDRAVLLRGLQQWPELGTPLKPSELLAVRPWSAWGLGPNRRGRAVLNDWGGGGAAFYKVTFI